TPAGPGPPPDTPLPAATLSVNGDREDRQSRLHCPRRARRRPMLPRRFLAHPAALLPARRCPGARLAKLPALPGVPALGRATLPRDRRAESCRRNAADGRGLTRRPKRRVPLANARRLRTC